MEYGPGPSTSRLSAFRFFSKNNASSSNLASSSNTSADYLRPPTPPAKDPSYAYSLRLGNASSPSLSPASPNGSHTPSRFLAKLGSLGRKGKKTAHPELNSLTPFGSIYQRPSNETTTASTAEPHPPTPSDGDGSITSPWNFQHHVHVDESFSGLPLSWASALAEEGFTPQEIASLQSQRQRARAQHEFPTATNHDRNTPSPISSHSPPERLLVPKPRSDSLRDSFASTLLPQQPFLRSNTPVPDSPTSLSSHSQSLSASLSGSRQSPSQVHSSSARNRRLTPLRVVNSEPGEVDDEDDEDHPLSPPPAYRPSPSQLTGISSTIQVDPSSGSGNRWTADVKEPIPSDSSTSAMTESAQYPTSLSGLQRDRELLSPPPPTRPPPPIPQETRVIENDAQQSEGDTPPPTPAKDYPPLAPFRTNDHQLLPTSQQETSSTLLPSIAEPQPLSPVTSSDHSSPSLLMRDSSTTMPPPPSRKPPPPPSDALQQQLELRHLQTLKRSHSDKDRSDARSPLSPATIQTNGSVSASTSPSHPYTSPYETLLLDTSDDEDESTSLLNLEDQPIERQSQDQRPQPKVESDEQDESLLILPHHPFAASDVSPIHPSPDTSSLSEEEALEKIPDVAPRLSLNGVSDAGKLGLDLGFDFGSSFGDALKMNLAVTPVRETGAQEDTKEERKSSKRVRELGLHVRTPSVATTSSNSATIPTESKGHENGSAISQAGDSASRTTSSYSRNTESSASINPSPLWREIMRLVNPDGSPVEPGERHQAAPIPSMSAGSSRPISQSHLPPPTTSPLLSPQLSASTQSHSDYSVTDSVPLLSPSLFPTPPTASIIQSAKRLSALKSPPPFPPPNYPLPNPLSDVEAVHSHETRAQHDLHSNVDERSDDDGEADISRDSISCFSEKVVMAEVLNVRIAKGKLQAIGNPVRASIPRSPGPKEVPARHTPVHDRASLRVSYSPSSAPGPAPLSPLPPTPHTSPSTPNSVSVQPLLTPSSASRVDSAYDATQQSPDSLIHLSEKSARKHSLNSVNKVNLRVSTESATEPAIGIRRSSPTILEEWLADSERHIGEGRSAETDSFPLNAYTDSPLDPGLPPSASPMPITPSIIVRDTSNPEGGDTLLHELSTSGVPPMLKPLAPYIHANVNPHTLFADLTPVAEGQYGPVYAAQSLYQDSGSPQPSETVVAIKCIPLNTPLQSVKIKQLETELSIMSNTRHDRILTMDDLYLQLDEVDAHGVLWVQMELMERSLADVLPLYDQFEDRGQFVTENMIARFAQDCLLAVEYLQQQGIAHRDVRSDNMLLSSEGVVKLADFANAVRITSEGSLCSDVVGVSHWQAPEIRSGEYDPLRVDVWGVGATVWELIEGMPPFSDIEDEHLLPQRWSPVSPSHGRSAVLEEFLSLCSEPAASRPRARILLKTPFIETSCPQAEIVGLIQRCREMEEYQS